MAKLAGSRDDGNGEKPIEQKSIDQLYIESLTDTGHLYYPKFDRSLNSWTANHLEETYQMIELDEATDLCLKNQVICYLFNGRGEKVWTVDQLGNRTGHM